MTLSTAQLRHHLLRVRYKPGWTFEIHEPTFETSPHIEIRATVPNAYHPDETVPLRVNSLLPPFDSTEAFTRWLLWRVSVIEHHEVLEWLQVDGKPYADPHRPHADRDQPLGAPA